MKRIEVPQHVFDAMKNEGTWDGTLSVLERMTGETADIWDEEVNADRSYHNDNECFVVGGRYCRQTIIKVKKTI